MEIKYAPIPEFSSRVDGKRISSINRASSGMAAQKNRKIGNSGLRK